MTIKVKGIVKNMNCITNFISESISMLKNSALKKEKKINDFQRDDEL